MKGRSIIISSIPVVLALVALRDASISPQEIQPVTDSTKWPKTFGFGRTATAAEITAWDIDVRPDGKGLPAGQGNVAQGKALYAVKCAACMDLTVLKRPALNCWASLW